MDHCNNMKEYCINDSAIDNDLSSYINNGL